MLRRFFKLNILAICTLMLCACGKDKAQPPANPTPQVTATSTPSPTPTKSPLDLCLEAPLVDGDGTTVRDYSVQYITSLYTRDRETLSHLLPEDLLPSEEELASYPSVNGSVSNVSVRYKKGLNEVDFFVYATYDLTAEGYSGSVPCLLEFGISLDNGKCTIYPNATDSEIDNAMLLSRKNPDVRDFYIKSRINQYIYSVLVGQEDLFDQVITDSEYVNFDNLHSYTQMIDSYEKLDYHTFDAPAEVEDIDCLVLVCEQMNFININTPAPGATEYLLALDDNNIPYVFIGVTSDAADSFRDEIRLSQRYNSIISEVSASLISALESDSELAAFYKKLYSDN